MKKWFSIVLSLLFVSASIISVKAEESVTGKLYSTVTDAGEVVDKLVLDFGNISVEKVDLDSFTVHVNAKYGIGENKGLDYYDIDRKIVKTEVKKNLVTLYMDQSEGSVLAYDSVSARNYPAILTYTITQNKLISVTSMDGTSLGEKTFNYQINPTINNEELSKFESRKIENGINYQLYKTNSDRLVVYFHGNGEGDVLNSQNNVAQLKGNRGAVSFTTSEHQAILGNANVIAFQAPDTWYYAQRDGLLEKAYNEIMDVVKELNINKENIAIYGLSAGGYMTTRMLIAYPQLFSAAMINCPALDVATDRGGNTPTDEELASIKKSKTPIWLVQGKTDSSVNTEDCSVRLFNILTKGQTLKTTTYTRSIASGFMTKETLDNKYKLTLYDTYNVDGKNKLAFSEDYNLDGTQEKVYYSDHWSWIYTLNNDPTDASNTHILNWFASFFKTKEVVKTENKPVVKSEGKATKKITKQEVKPVKEKQAKVVKVTQAKQAKAVQTGDNTNFVYFYGALISMFLLILLTTLYKRKMN